MINRREHLFSFTTSKGIVKASNNEVLKAI